MIYPNGNAALRNIDLTIEDNEFVFVVGQSGAGKTTLTKLLIAEERVSDGEMYINDFKMHRLRKYKIPKLRRSIGMVFQDFRLIPSMNVYDNIAYAMRVIGARETEIRKRVPYLLGLVGLNSKARSFPNQLSGGEQQRVVIARALLNAPGLILADEPTGNLDPETGKGIMDLLYSISQAGMTVIMSTHNPAWPEQYPGRKLQFADGKISEV